MPNRFLKYQILAAGLASGSGCAIQRYDPETGHHEVWGFGHLSMRVLPETEGLVGVVQESSVVGAAVGISESGMSVMVGSSTERRLEIVQSDAALRLEWPRGGFMNVRLGAAFPGGLYAREEEQEYSP